jgi:anti-sigma factor RsiW
MCDVQTKLVAWLDGELSPDEAARVQRHVEECRDCAGRIAAYETVSKTLAGYCEAVAFENTRSRVRRWVPVLAGGVVAAGLLALAFVFPRAQIAPRPVVTSTIAPVSVPVPMLAPAAVETAPRKTIRKRHAVAPIQMQNGKWQPMEAAVQIAIPAEAMFAPGAVPRGMNFIAELSIAPDGSVKQVRLRL